MNTDRNRAERLPTKDWTDVSNDDYWGGVSGKKPSTTPSRRLQGADLRQGRKYALCVAGLRRHDVDDTNHGATQNGQWFPAAGTRVYASGGLDHQELNPYGGMWIGTAEKPAPTSRNTPNSTASTCSSSTANGPLK
ncbi:MAG: hypothetical protein ACLRM8_07585 [Alistipes sp.]